jgi:hypothetical protein
MEGERGWSGERIAEMKEEVEKRRVKEMSLMG